ncbi:phage tail protein [Epibacterium sp. MM17-32]|uniref:TipJ family phage tail tip protein n=1 Tax=Epibacterium sp. MM17-32 TaxID=2917734 RepID=UPI001EF5068C|nr:phage tail protein [Epibacterium sp. MM17-32]MCG7628984.1 phage tail protein [Epibacterium sp. MM17-32]
MNKPVHLSGSGGGGGGGHTPIITPDTLISKDIVEFTLGLCEGPIAGLIDGPKSFYLDDTPLVSQSDDNNFNPFELHLYHGDENASDVRNALGGVVSNFQVGVRLAQYTPVTRVTPQSLRGEIDRLEVRINFNTLVASNDQGDQLEETARFRLLYREAGALEWQNFFGEDQVLKAELTSSYQYRKRRPGRDEGYTTVTVEKTADISRKGKLSSKHPLGHSNFSIAGGSADTSKSGYNQSKVGTYGTLYLNTSNDQYTYVPDPAKTANLSEHRTETFHVNSPEGNSTLRLQVRSASIIELRGKTTSGYVKEFVKGVPKKDVDWEIQVEKLSPDNEPQTTVVMTWESYQAVTQENRSYDNLAVARGLGQASDQFAGIPRFSGVYGCKLVRVPSNYDPITRYCSGPWDGTFKLAHTDNPAWCLYDLMTNETYGLKRYYPHLRVDRYSFYDAAKWCDELVPRPGGGYQPRFTYNDKIEQPRNAIEMMFQIAGIFGAIPVTDLNGTVSLKIDKPGIPVQIFGPESVTSEGFQYSFSDMTQRPNDISVKFINPTLDFEEDVRQVFDKTLIDTNGRIPDEMVALGCNDVYEAQRRAFRRLLQANTETTTVSFQTARMGLGLELFDLIGIVDPQMNWGVSGRVKSCSGNTIHLRDTLFLPTNKDLDLQVQTPSGVHDLVVRASQPAARNLTIKSGFWPSDAPEFAQFAISAQQVGLTKPFRILSIQEDAENPELLTITALEQNVNKYADADNMASSGTVNYESNWAKFPDSPVVTKVESGTDHLYKTKDGKIVSRIYLEWEHNPSSFVDEFLVFYRRKGVEPRYQSFSVRGRDAFIDNVPDGATYQIYVLAVNPLGRRSRNPIRFTHTVVGKTERPSDVTGLSATQIGPDVRLSFDDVEDVDLSHYSVKLGKVGDTWSTAKYIGQTTTNEFVDRNIRLSPAVYFVKAVDTSKNQSKTAAELEYVVPAPSTPTVTISFDRSRYVLNITPDQNDEVPVSEYIVRRNGNEIFRGKSSRFTGRADWIGTKTFEVSVVNRAGQESPVKTISGNIVAPAAPDMAAFIAETTYYLQWNVPTSTLPISHYVVKDVTANTILEEASPGNIYSGNVEWIGNRDFEVYAVDTAGNAGQVASTYVNVVAPVVTGLQSEVSRSQLKLTWTGNKESLPIRQYRIYEGSSFETARELGRINAETFSVPVTWNGSKTFYVVAVDTAGNVSAPTSVIETIDPPGVPEVLADIVDQNVHLSWSDAATELLINHVELESQLHWHTDTFDPQIGEAGEDITSVVLNVDHLVLSTTATPSMDTTGDTTGFKLTLPAKLTKQWYGEKITVRVKAASSGANPGEQLIITYSTNEAGSAGQNVFTVDATPTWYEFDYTLSAPGSKGTIDNYIGVWAEAGKDIGIWEVELLTERRLFQKASGSATTFPAKFLGTTLYYTTPIDEAGNRGGTGEAQLRVEAPEAFNFAARIKDTLADFNWDTPNATLPISYYELRRGEVFATSSSIARLTGNAHSFPADWVGTEVFWIVAYDTAGNPSPAQIAEVDIVAPSAPSPRSEVIDNNVLLRWSNGSGTLPVVATEIRKGETYETAEVMQQMDANFATFFEFNSGSYKYWLTNIDSAGNWGTPAAITTVVNEPPDFVLQTAMTSDFSGTMNQVIMGPNGLLFGIDETKTVDDHFQDYGFDTPQQQVDAGYPIFIQPVDHLTLATYQEEFDTGGVLKASIITVTPTAKALAGDGEIAVDIEYREKETDPWTKRENQNRIYAQNFRYVRFTLRLAADSRHDLVEVSRIDMRLNVKIRNDAGSGVANATDTNGTQVNFNVEFVDVASITVTPNTTTPVIPVYDFEDTQNPTGFTVYLFDKNGNRVSGDFSWAVRGY